MAKYDALLEPFTPQTLHAIRTAFQAGWNELERAGLTADPTRTRNKLAGTIANLARKGVLDPGELRDRALGALNASVAPSDASPVASLDRREPARAEA